MLITMTETDKGSRCGIIVEAFKQGETYDVSDDLGQQFLNRGTAIVKAETQPALENKALTIGENKTSEETTETEATDEQADEETTEAEADELAPMTLAQLKEKLEHQNQGVTKQLLASMGYEEANVGADIIPADVVAKALEQAALEVDAD